MVISSIKCPPSLYSNILPILLTCCFVAHYWGRAPFQAYKHPETFRSHGCRVVKHTLMSAYCSKFWPGSLASCLITARFLSTTTFKLQQFYGFLQMKPLSSSAVSWITAFWREANYGLQRASWIRPLYPLTYFRSALIVLVLGLACRLKRSLCWPYGFMDFDKLGVPMLLWPLWFWLRLCCPSYLYVVIDKKLAGRFKKAENQNGLHSRAEVKLRMKVAWSRSSH